MLKSTWTGTIAFGLVSVPVKLFGATQDHGVALHRTHETCLLGDYTDAGHRLSQQMVCKDCGDVVPYAEQGSVFVDVDGVTVPLARDEMVSLPGDKSRTIDLLEFVDPADIDPLHWGKSYYVHPDVKAAKGQPIFQVLHAALQATGKVAVGRITLRSRESLVAILPREDGLVARVILWADEVRALEVNDPPSTVRAPLTAEVAQAVALVEAMSCKFDIDQHVDQRDQALAALIASKMPTPEPGLSAHAQIIDLTARLAEHGASAIVS